MPSLPDQDYGLVAMPAQVQIQMQRGKSTMMDGNLLQIWERRLVVLGVQDPSFDPFTFLSCALHELDCVEEPLRVRQTVAAGHRGCLHSGSSAGVRQASSGRKSCQQSQPVALRTSPDRRRLDERGGRERPAEEVYPGVQEQREGS
jgi:hypothetical protein